MAKSPRLLHLVTDYGTGDLAFAEVIQRLTHLLPDINILPTSTPPFSTLDTGFIIAQLALYNPSDHIFIFSNTAPRKDDPHQRPQNAGEKFKYALLDNGVPIAAVDAGYCFSFVKPHLKQLKVIQVDNQGSQFRSRDFYPPAVAQIINHQPSVLGKSISPDTIPDVPKNRLAHIDGYGNLKTTIRHSSLKLKSKSKINITLNQTTQTAVYADGSFSVKSGQLAFAPGSSGGDDRFMEIFLRGASAAKLFNQPTVEAEIDIQPT